MNEKTQNILQVTAWIIAICAVVVTVQFVIGRRRKNAADDIVARGTVVFAQAQMRSAKALERMAAQSRSW